MAEGIHMTTDLSKLTKAQLMALVAASGTTASRPRKGAKSKATKATKRTPHVTDGFTLVTDRRAGTEGCEWASEYAELEFCDAEGKPHTGALREDDSLGQEMIAEIKTYAKNNAIGRSRVRYNRKINAWTGPLAMFPERLRKLAGI